MIRNWKLFFFLLALNLLPGYIAIQADDWLPEEKIDHPVLQAEIKTLFQLGFYDLTIEKIENYLHQTEINSARAGYYLIMAQCYLELKQFPTAILSFQELLAQFPAVGRRDQAQFGIGQAYFYQGQFRQAEAIFTDFIIEHASSHQLEAAIFFLAESELQQQKDSEAIGHYQKLITGFPQSPRIPESYLKIGEIRETHQDYDLAEQTYQLLATHYSGHPLGKIGLFRQGFCAYRAQRFPAAVEILTRARAQNSDHELAGQAQFILAESNFQMQQYNQALQDYQTLIQTYPQSAWLAAAYYGLGWVYSQLGNYEAAQQTFEKLSGLQPKNSWTTQALYQSGRCYLALKLPLRARENFLTIIQDFPQDSLAPDALYEIGLLDFDQRNFPQAILFFKKIIENHARHPLALQACLMAGESHSQLEQITEAEKWYELLISQARRRPETYVAYYQSGRSALAKGQFTTALARLDTVIHSSADSVLKAAAFFWKAETCWQMKEYVLALQNYQQSLQFGKNSPRSPEIYYFSGWGALKLSQYELARTCFDQAFATARQPQLRQDAWLRGADARYFQQDYPAAIPLYRDFLAQPATGLPAETAQFQLANSFYHLAEYESAIREYQVFLRKFPYSWYRSQTEYQIGKAYFELKFFDEAANHFKTVVTSTTAPSLLEAALYAEANCYYNSGRYDWALIRYQRLQHDFPKSKFASRALSGLHWTLFQQGKSKEALAAIEKYLQQSTRSDSTAEFQFRKAEMLFKLERYAQALPEFQKVLLLDSTAETARRTNYWLGETYLKLKQPAQALAFWSRQYQQYPNHAWSPLALVRKGEYYAQNQALNQALATYDSLLQKYPTDPRALQAGLTAGDWRLASKDTLGAENTWLTVLKNAAAQKQISATVRLKLGRFYLQQQKYAAAMTILNTLPVTRNDEIAAEAQFLLAEIYLAQSEINEAMYAFLKVKYLFPFFDDWCAQSVFRAAEINEQIHNLDEARKLYELVYSEYKNKEYRDKAFRKLRQLKSATKETIKS
ncbi:tetratricopeptide repeat protein [candidate division KSB1 bacterium]|nr:tetratricopeptide repeat protein [candidate division KSB1 bacterium]